jgi:hypothetical protein
MTIAGEAISSARAAQARPQANKTANIQANTLADMRIFTIFTLFTLFPHMETKTHNVPDALPFQMPERHKRNGRPLPDGHFQHELSTGHDLHGRRVLQKAQHSPVAYYKGGCENKFIKKKNHLKNAFGVATAT